MEMKTQIQKCEEFWMECFFIHAKGNFGKFGVSCSIEYADKALKEYENRFVLVKKEIEQF